MEPARPDAKIVNFFFRSGHLTLEGPSAQLSSYKVTLGSGSGASSHALLFASGVRFAWSPTSKFQKAGLRASGLGFTRGV